MRDIQTDKERKAKLDRKRVRVGQFLERERETCVMYSESEKNKEEKETEQNELSSQTMRRPGGGKIYFSQRKCHPSPSPYLLFMA